MTGPPENKWVGPALPSRLRPHRAIGARKNLFAYAKTYKWNPVPRTHFPPPPNLENNSSRS